MSKPTIHVTNWSSKKLRGPGKRWTIITAPRLFEMGDGECNILVPRLAYVRAAKAGRLHMADYRRFYIAEVNTDWIVPGQLLADRGMTTVTDGDTLCCACSRKAAAKGECHRAWAAALLVRAGWRVILDGQEVRAFDEETGVPLFEMPF